MAYYKINPSGITDDAMPLFYDDDLIPAIDEANTANVAFGRALENGVTVWELAGRTKRIIDAQVRLIDAYGSAYIPGRHRMDKHVHADLGTVIVMAETYLDTAGYPRGQVGWEKPLAPFQKRFPLGSWARRCLSRFIARQRLPEPWTPTTQPPSAVNSLQPARLS